MSIKIAPRKASKPSDVATQPLAVSVREVAAMLSVSERSVWNLAKTGKIQSRKIGARTIFPLASIHEFLNGTDSSGDATKLQTE